MTDETKAFTLAIWLAVVGFGVFFICKNIDFFLCLYIIFIRSTCRPIQIYNRQSILRGMVLLTFWIGTVVK